MKTIVKIWVLMMVIVIWGCKERTLIQNRDTASQVHHSTDKINLSKYPTFAKNPPKYFDDYYYKDPIKELAPSYKGLKLKRSISGRELDITLTGYNRGEGFEELYREDLPNFTMIRILEFNPGVLVYEAPSDKIDFDRHIYKKIEFLDTLGQTISTYDILDNSPYTSQKSNKRFTYKNFDSEGMSVLSKEKLEPRIGEVDEESLFVRIFPSGLHMVVDYEIREIIDNSFIVDTKHTIVVLDGKGNTVHTLENIPSFQTAAISEDGRYMMYKTGDMALGSADQSRATVYREGYLIIDLSTRDTLYHEYTDDGVRSFNGTLLYQGLLWSAFSTPSDPNTLDYYVFFDPKSKTLYRKMVTRPEWDDFVQYSKDANRFSYREGLELLNFEKIQL